MQAPLLAQRGRAQIDFQAGLGKASYGLNMAMEAEMAAKGINAETLPDDIDARHAMVDEKLADSKTFKLRQLVGEWSSKTHGPFCEEAFEGIRHELEPMLKSLDDGPSKLTVPENFEAPSYFSRVWFHRTTGGWDASDYNGYVHGELVHKMLVAKSYPGDIFAQRRMAAKQASRKDFKRILDVGASSGHYTLALQEAYPNAQIVGIDPSPRMLEHARRVANENGWNWDLHVGLGEDTGFPDQSFDLVTSFILFHEIPPRIIKAVFEEAYRLLEPGGEIIMTDVPRYHEMDKLAVWRYDWLAKWGGEPYWRASASMDLVQTAKDAGFVDVEAFTQEPVHTYYVVRAKKPA